ncbi:TolC family protein [Fimbriimonas ginsengisoli]|uniref:Outer membrane efflux protein n=1 Tax=Fimbriimonas ginsengisoli Gsoil 348 TaxID=661478 RepID=A0A068NPT8_FIMGI|nr:TolC family protein [Fimbriimonas ginsengisoli]AIE85397.1 outer membrane efflux protein [Fimbriimonas ginsengisoli Gsoil 348]
MPRPIRTLSLFMLVLVASPSLALAQDSTLTLDQALRLAKERNGTIRSAQYDVNAAESRVTQAFSAFLPTVTPQYQYNNIRRDGNQPLFVTNGDAGLLSGNWRLLDSGERDFSYRSSKHSLYASRFNAKQTLRTTLFAVTQQFYDALRFQELARVADSQVDRAQTIYDQTMLRIKLRDAAAIEELQADADLQNAKVAVLTARNRVTNAAASLKSAIGLDAGQALPTLEKDTAELPEMPGNLDSIVTEGLRQRPDLLSRREALDSERLTRSRAQREAGVSFALDLSNDYQFSPSRLNNRNLGLVVSYPLFDGGRTRAIVRELSANISADSALLLQAERDARAEIEAAAAEARTNRERLVAAKKALDAAQKNFEAAVNSRSKGASDLLQVITAQVSLVTAESNHIEAQYDSRISDARLRLVTGQPVPGEDNP